MTRHPPNTNAAPLQDLLHAVGTMVRAQTAKEAKESAKSVIEEWRALEALVRG